MFSKTVSTASIALFLLALHRIYFAGQTSTPVPKAKAKNKAKAKAKSLPGGVTEVTAKTIDERRAEMSLALSILILPTSPEKYMVC